MSTRKTKTKTLQVTSCFMVKNEWLPAKIRNKAKISTLIIPFTIIVEVLATKISQEEEGGEGIKMVKEEMKLSSLADTMIPM